MNPTPQPDENHDSIRPAKPAKHNVGWWITAVSGALAIVYYVVCGANHLWGDPQHDVPVFVHDGTGQPLRGIHLRCEDGKIVELDEGGNAVIPKQHGGKLVSVRDAKTGRQLREVLIPKVVEVRGAFEIVVPKNGEAK